MTKFRKFRNASKGTSSRGQVQIDIECTNEEALDKLCVALKVLGYNWNECGEETDYGFMSGFLLESFELENFNEDYKNEKRKLK